ncbi:MAG: HYExAFE family protein [Planctomycetota bacterium]
MAAADYPNHYEQALAGWLMDNRVQFVPVDQQKRVIFSRSKMKSFDFLLYPRSSTREVIVAEAKGRKFSGSSLAGRPSLQCWVTMEDVRGLLGWEDVFGSGYTGAFVFVYCFEKIDVDPDKWQIYEFDDRRYFFVMVMLDDYRKFMKIRSRKWQTVTLSTENFRSCMKPIEKVLM